MMRSVTAATVGFSAMISLVPGDAVAFGQRDGSGRPPCPRRIGSGSHSLLCPGGANAVDPGPLRLDLVAADEQGGIAFDEVEQQPLVSNPAPVFAEGVRETDIERDLAKADALAV